METDCPLCSCLDQGKRPGSRDSVDCTSRVCRGPGTGDCAGNTSMSVSLAGKIAGPHSIN